MPLTLILTHPKVILSQSESLAILANKKARKKLGMWIPGKILALLTPNTCLEVRIFSLLLAISANKMCHMSGTMLIGFLVKFYPILTPQTCLKVK